MAGLTGGDTFATAREGALVIRTILAALDSSPRAGAVFDVGARFAERFHARLVILRVIDASTAVASEGIRGDVRSSDMAAALTNLATIVLGRGGMAAVAARVRSGVPWRAILDTSEEENADLVVIGSHRYRGLEHVTGSTESGVVNRSRRSVYVVHGL